MDQIQRWLDQFYRAGDAVGGDSQRLCSLLRTAELFGKSAPPYVTLDKLNEARTMAVRRLEMRAAYYADHWGTRLLFQRLGDYAAALRVVREALIEADRPIYDDFPVRTLLRDDLARILTGIHPQAHQSEIEATIDRLTAEVTPGSYERVSLLDLHASYLLEIGCTDEAELKAREAACEAAAVSEPDLQASAHVTLCRIAYLRKDCDRLRSLSRQESAFWDVADHIYLAELQMWNAYSLARAGNSRASGVYLTAIERARRSQAVALPGTYDASCAYHETAGNLLRAIAARSRQIGLITGKGRIALESRCKQDHIRLIALAGLVPSIPLESDL